ncbi:MAG: hypothetical protein GX591_20545 [Planctomycetes bacterium]|nr:hypothetical protein [Planctomycetota bacterium]
MTLIARSSAVRLRWPQQSGVAWFNIYSDGGSGGAIDYDTPLNARPIVAWPDGEGYGGWGLGRWGYGRWGASAAGAGWGLGLWGFGPWGYGRGGLAHVVRYLADGTHTFAVVGFDAAGNAVTPAAVTAAVTVAAAPRPPSRLRPTAWDGPNNTLTLSYTLSPDDSG